MSIRHCLKRRIKTKINLFIKKINKIIYRIYLLFNYISFQNLYYIIYIRNYIKDILEIT